jgi:hypothetical protein
MNAYLLLHASSVVAVVWYVALLCTLGLFGVAIKLLALSIAVQAVATVCVFSAAYVKHLWDTRPVYSKGVIIPTHVEIVR